MGIKKILAATMTAGIVLSIVPAVSFADSTGWKKDDVGWKYYTFNSGFVKSDWKQIGGKWYYFMSSGYMLQGVTDYMIGGIYYNFDNSGACTNPGARAQNYSGWHKICDCYYDYSIKEIVTDYNWYYYESNGDLASGWRNIDGKTYYFDEYNYKMFYNKKGDLYPHWIANDNYWFKESGELVTGGWYNCGDAWRYADSDGVLYCSKWLNDGGKTYYFDMYGRMISGVNNVEIRGSYYDFNSDGSCKNPDGYKTTVRPGWNRVYEDGEKYYWYYYKDDLSMHFGWLNIGGKWYYLNDYNGKMIVGTDYIDNVTYYFKEGGEMAVGWVKLPDVDGMTYWRYADSSGALYYGKWLNDKGKWYYFSEDNGMMVYGVNNYYINGVYYNFDSNGVCTNPNAGGNVTGWIKKSTMYGYTWNYYGSDGSMYKNEWLSDGGSWYYFTYDGTMVNYASFYLGGVYYDFDSNGVCLNPYDPRSTY